VRERGREARWDVRAGAYGEKRERTRRRQQTRRARKSVTAPRAEPAGRRLESQISAVDFTLQ